MSKGNMTLIFNPLWPEHIGKDVFLVPYYLGKRFDYSVDIVYSPSEKSKNLPESLNGVKLVPLKLHKRESMSSMWDFFYTCFYIIKYAKSIDLLMFIRSCSPYYEFLSLLYKKLNSKGKVYVKLDINLEAINVGNSNSRFSIKRLIHKQIKISSLKLINCFSCETSVSYQQIKESRLLQFQFGDKLQLMPNGFDEELLQTIQIEERKFEEKENLIITVGRLGSPEKNTEMLLRALTKVSLDKWKVCLIGPIDPRIEQTIEHFYRDNPDKLESVKFTNAIYDKKKLWEYYNRAKVFVLTSDWEGYPIVYPEAKRFINYIVSTDVAACQDVIEDGKYGVSIPINDDLKLSTILNEIVTGQRNIDVYEGFDIQELSWDSQIKKIQL
jgi:GalNAc-alpha-(1->4)-GalNAc-alpha-(1->3)-diNAcBac-PP-undecaprenol alpha-1,4-N-acetyl-D-galactosaminyltransferase